MHREHESDPRARSAAPTAGGECISRRSLVFAGTAAAAAATLSPPGVLAQSAGLAAERGTKFERIRTQFIAALGDPDATAGNNAHLWGLWRRDPGPRGVSLDGYERLKASGVAPAGWQFDGTDWWLEEHGLIMEPPEFPIAPRQYMVTGNRDAKSVLTVHAPASDGTQRWELAGGATLYDVTHLRCRSARYTPAAGGASCSPASAQPAAFPVRPGAPMPPVDGCAKQDYTVLIVLGVAVERA